MIKEVRIHGRGGQGAVTTGQLLAIAAFNDNKYSQSFPMFGVERAGAPVQAFTRISDKEINIRTQVYEPDYVIVLDSALISQIDVTAGLKKGSTIIVNSNKENIASLKGYNAHVIDATSVALKIFKRPIVNTAVLGAFAKLTGLVTLKGLYRAVDEIFLRTKGKQIAELNKKAISHVYKQTH